MLWGEIMAYICGVETVRQSKTTTMNKATLKFSTREVAERFATDWGRYSKRGHIVGAGTENVEVMVFDLTDNDRAWIDNYAAKINT